jgi:hypothetical protein
VCSKREVDVNATASMQIIQGGKNHEPIFQGAKADAMTWGYY